MRRPRRLILVMPRPVPFAISLYFLAVAMLPAYGLAAETRSWEAKVAFAKTHPCPSSGIATPSCTGYVIDHIKPLCAGGADAPSNMQWQDLQSSHIKDKWEWEVCRMMKKKGCS